MRWSNEFRLPESSLSSLPTGAVKVVVDTLGRHIANRRYAPGETLPREETLSKEHGVSRTVLRESIKVLSGKGMVRTARRYGTRVCAFEDWNLLDPDVIGWHDPSSPAAERIRSEAAVMRSIFEPEAAWLAARNATEAQVETILSAAGAITTEHAGLEGIIAADYTFHDTVLKAAGNMMLGQLTGLIQSVLPFHHVQAQRRPEDLDRLRSEHLAVAEAIAARDPALARNRMRALVSRHLPAEHRMGDA